MMSSDNLPGLFDPRDPSAPGIGVWIGGRHEDLERLASGFRVAAHQLAETWQECPDRHEGLVFPILQTYRHAIELILKSACGQVAQLIEKGNSIGVGRDTRPANLDDRLNTHSIAKLVDLFNELFPGLAIGNEPAEFPPDTKLLLESLHSWDDKGQSFRYVTSWDREKKTWAPVRPESILVDFESAIARLDEAAGLLNDGISGYLDAYGQFLDEIYSEYWSNF